MRLRRTLPTLQGSLRSGTPRRRWLLIGASVLVAVLATLYWVRDQRIAHEQKIAAGLVQARAKAAAIARAKAKASTHPESNKVVQSITLASTGRVVPSTQSEELFAPHSWYVPPPPPPPPPPMPAAAPTAPPLPYTYVGSYIPDGETATYFLARGDRVVDAHIGDKLDGSLLFEKVEGNQLVFNYLPLNIRQTLPAGVAQ